METRRHKRKFITTPEDDESPDNLITIVDIPESDTANEIIVLGGSHEPIEFDTEDEVIFFGDPPDPPEYNTVDDLFIRLFLHVKPKAGRTKNPCFSGLFLTDNPARIGALTPQFSFDQLLNAVVNILTETVPNQNIKLVDFDINAQTPLFVRVQKPETLENTTANLQPIRRNLHNERLIEMIRNVSFRATDDESKLILDVWANGQQTIIENPGQARPIGRLARENGVGNVGPIHISIYPLCKKTSDGTVQVDTMIVMENALMTFTLNPFEGRNISAGFLRGVVANVYGNIVGLKNQIGLQSQLFVFRKQTKKGNKLQDTNMLSNMVTELRKKNENVHLFVSMGKKSSADSVFQPISGFNVQNQIHLRSVFDSMDRNDVGLISPAPLSSKSQERRSQTRLDLLCPREFASDFLLKNLKEPESCLYKAMTVEQYDRALSFLSRQDAKNQYCWDRFPCRENDKSTWPTKLTDIFMTCISAIFTRDVGMPKKGQYAIEETSGMPIQNSSREKTDPVVAIFQPLLEKMAAPNVTPPLLSAQSPKLSSYDENKVYNFILMKDEDIATITFSGYDLIRRSYVSMSSLLSDNQDENLSRVLTIDAENERKIREKEIVMQARVMPDKKYLFKSFLNMPVRTVVNLVRETTPTNIDIIIRLEMEDNVVTAGRRASMLDLV